MQMVAQLYKSFGLTLCKSRMVIECSFGRPKARFGVFKRAMDINMDELPGVIYACFVLHNYCELKNEKIGEEKVASAINYDREFQPAVVTNNFTTDCNEGEGKKIRRILTRYFDPREHDFLMNMPRISNVFRIIKLDASIGKHGELYFSNFCKYCKNSFI